MAEEEEYTYVFGDETFGGYSGEMTEVDQEIMVLECMYPDCITRDPDNKGISVLLKSLTEGVPDCDVHFVFADGYPSVRPPMKSIKLNIHGETIYQRIKCDIEKRLYNSADLLVEKGETVIVSFLLEELSRMMIVGARSSELENSIDAFTAFSYSMNYVDCDPTFVNHPLIGSLFSMVTTDVLMLIMEKMDGGTLFRFTDSCKLFRALGDQHPDLFRMRIHYQFRDRNYLKIPTSELRSTLHDYISRDKSDPVIRKLREKALAEQQEEQERIAKQERMASRKKTLSHRYNNVVTYEFGHEDFVLPKSNRPTFWEQREAIIAARAAKSADSDTN